MKISVAFANTNQLFLDSAPLIYLVEANHAYFQLVQPIFAMIDSGRLKAITSPISLSECLVVPIREGKLQAVNTFTNLITSGINTTFVMIDGVIGRTAAGLRAKYNFKLPDSIQLAAAIVSGCESFLTNDRQLRQVTEINVIVLDDLELG